MNELYRCADGPPAVETSGLRVRYGKVVAIDGLDLRVEAGEVFGLLGPNGSGKTTVVRTIATLLRPTSGSVSVFGIDAQRAPDRVRREIGLAGQSASVEPTLTGRQNLSMIARLYGHRAKAVRREADRVVDMLDLGAVAERRVATYSGGERRRLDLGASLVGAPRLLLLDEPTTGLDPRSRLAVWSAVGELAGRGTSVLLTTQYLEEVDHLARHVVILDHGTAVASGSPQTLKSRVGRDRIEITVREPSAIETVTAVVASWGAPEPNLTTRRVTVQASSGIGQLAQVADALARKDVAIESIALRPPTLDEVFLALTAPATPTERMETSR